MAMSILIIMRLEHVKVSEVNLDPFSYWREQKEGLNVI